MKLDSLPQLGDRPYLTDGGLELHLIYERGWDLPDFAAYPLLLEERGRRDLMEYSEAFLKAVQASDVGLILETPTWRASADWGRKLGHNQELLRWLNADAVRFLRELGRRRTDGGAVLVSGCMGPRGDGYSVGERMTPEESRAYHTPQLEAFAEGGADHASAMTLTYAAEAAGIARAAQDVGLPVVLSFTVEVDGHLPSGETLGQALADVERTCEGYPAYYMLNCAYPTHMEPALVTEWTLAETTRGSGPPTGGRVRGLKPNASPKSHAELNESASPDRGDPEDLARRCLQLRERFPGLNVFGGCCGTGIGHFKALIEALAAAQSAP